MATILVVDDEPDILELIRVNLELDGHQVVTSSTGNEALTRLRESVPDLILLDVNMPGVDGFAVLSHIKSESNRDVSQVPVLMVTARTATEDRIRGSIEGALRYLTKPFSPSDLREEVREALTGEPEPVKRQRVRFEALEELVRGERAAVSRVPAAGFAGAEALEASVRPRLTRFERRGDTRTESPAVRAARQNLAALSPKQLLLLQTLSASRSVSEAAAKLEVSRSNVYASLRRIGRKLGTRSVPELLALVRAGGLPLDQPPPS